MNVRRKTNASRESVSEHDKDCKRKHTLHSSVDVLTYSVRLLVALTLVAAYLAFTPLRLLIYYVGVLILDRREKHEQEI